LETEKEIKKIEDKLNYINGIYARAGIFLSTREKTNIFILLVALIYLEYSEINLKEIFKQINRICEIEISELEDVFRTYELNSKPNSSDIYADFMNTIISFKDIDRFAFIDYVLENRFNYETSYSLGRFSANILDQVPNAKLLDAYSGNGYFDCDYLNLNKSAEIDGYEINQDSVNVAKAINYIFNTQFNFSEYSKCKNCNYIQTDFLTTDLKENYYDLAFADCPIGLRYDRNNISNIELATKFVKNNVISIPWLTALKMEKCLNDKGKAVIVCSAGSLFGIVDREVRKYFVEKNLISQIIELPDNINLYSRVKLYLIVVEKGKKDKNIKFSDVSDCITKERRINKINIQDALEEVKNNSVEISLKEIEKNDYMLDVNRYINNNKITIENGIILDEISEKIFRGYQFTASQIDEMYTTDEKEANYKILEVSNIDKFGNIDNNLKFINSGEKDLSKHLLQNYDIVLSSKGFNTKMAIIENINNDENIIPSGSLIVIRLNRNKIIPMYLKAFLESETGKIVLNSVKTGIAIPTIIPSSLMKIIVKCPSIEEQKEFVDKYMIKYELCKITEEKMNKYIKELKALIDQI
jgi:type I restriction-modification system DNA methylase subunit